MAHSALLPLGQVLPARLAFAFAPVSTTATLCTHTPLVPHLHPCHTVDRPEFEAVLQACRGGLGMVVEAYFDHVDARKIDREARVRVRRIYAGGEVLGHRLDIGWTNA